MNIEIELPNPAYNPDKPPCQICKAECCRNIPMKFSDYDRLQALKPRFVEKFKIKKLGPDLMISGRCPWVAKDNSCSVYDDRPLACVITGTKERPCHRMPGFEQAINAVIDRLKGVKR